ncbi:hypothetical protein [Ligilactobacillus agilis]|uniref:hypothetical protein n=1 Tax=Ligilactobacillus agilis TaxID=1601 RepID=UPI0022DF69AD|nr:hypothetical protein [Ligilactobacillus agilis]
MKQYLADNIKHSDILALRRHMSALDEVLTKLDRDRANGYKEPGNEKRALREMSYVGMLMHRLAGGELPPAEINVLTEK